MWSEGYTRYRTPIADLFSAENKLALQLQTELKLTEALEELGKIPNGISTIVSEKIPKVKLSRVEEIDKEINHDLMAVVRALAEQCGDAGEWIHYTATSMDIQDTVLAQQMRDAKTIILEELKKTLGLLREKIQKYKSVPTIGRTHGQFAVPTTVGFKFSNYYYEFYRSYQELLKCDVAISKFSGAVGNYASSHSRELEALVLQKLGLSPVPISTQVVTRLVHSSFLYHLAQVASVIERLSKEIRHLQRSEIQEWFEPRSSKQVGSSAMPHKRNPHKTERLNGLARVVRSNVSVGLENIALEHEREISNSAPERLVIPESVIVSHYMILQINAILDGLEINDENLKKNLEKAAVGHSEQILRELVPKVGRQTGHELLRKYVGSKNFKQDVLNDSQIKDLVTEKKLREIFDTFDVGLAIEKSEEVLSKFKV